MFIGVSSGYDRLEKYKAKVRAYTGTGSPPDYTAPVVQQKLALMYRKVPENNPTNDDFPNTSHCSGEATRRRRGRSGPCFTGCSVFGKFTPGPLATYWPGSLRPRWPRFGVAGGPERRMGRDCRDGCGDDRSGGTWEHAGERLPEGLPMVFGENSGGHPGSYPGASPQDSCGKAGGCGQGASLPGDA